MKNVNGIKIAVVHDWLTGMRGGEKVLESILEIFPESDVFTLMHNPGSVSSLIESKKIHTSFIDRLPFKSTKYRHYLPLFPTAIELFNFKEYDLIISTSHCVAKGIITPPDAMHISYVHSPMRYVWDMYDEYFGKDKIGALQQVFIPPLANYLRTWDVTSSNRVDYFVANSRHVANRILKYYRRDAEVIYPPVNTDLFQLSDKNEDFYLIVSALVPYKKVDLAIKTFNQLNRSLYIIGDGPEKNKLINMAKNNIKFFKWTPNEKLVEYYSKCKGLIFPGEEDFGIVPVEIQSCGKPVIAYAKGGALETVIGYNSKNEKNCTGVFFHEQSIESLTKAIQLFENLTWDAKFIQNHAQAFSTEKFKTKFKSSVESKLKIHNGRNKSK